MNPDTITYLQGAAWSLGGQTLQELSFFLPKLLAAGLVVIVGVIIARIIRNIVIRVFTSFKVSKMVANTPVEVFLKSTDTTGKIEHLIGNFFYWMCMLVVLHTAVVILGLGPVSMVFAMVLAYIPHLFSAFFILLIGIILAGLAESVVKGAIHTTDRRFSRLAGKAIGYGVIVISILAAISELGIASEFIMVLFVGFVAAAALATGLALGLGGQTVVKKMLDDWYHQSQKK